MTPMTDGFEMAPLSTLYESATNPRRRYDARGLAELTASVKAQGVLVPLLVRRKVQSPRSKVQGPESMAEEPAPPENGGAGACLEVIAGSRRLRAARGAGLETVPVRVVGMTDTQVLEVQVIENLQREDVHPLDEALGYRALMAQAGYDAPAIAAKVGKSETYVYGRLKLTELIAPAQEMFLADAITAGHALLIARLQPADQERALEACFNTWWDGENRQRGLVGVRVLEAWIKQEILLDLHAAPFKKNDAGLVAPAGACTVCAKRTGFQPALFPEIQKADTCTDPACYQAKIQAHIAQQKRQLAATGAPVLEVSSAYYEDRDNKKLLCATKYEVVTKKTPCAHARTAIVTAGPRDVGKVLTICAEPTCRVHHPGGAYHRDPQEAAREKAQQKTARLEAAARQRILAAVVERVPAAPAREDLVLVAEALVMATDQAVVKAVAKKHQWEAKKEKYNQADWRGAVTDGIRQAPDPALTALLIELSLIMEMDIPAWSDRTAKRLLATAERYGVDAAGILAAVAAEAKAKEKKAKEKKAKTAPAKREKKKSNS